MRPDLRQLLKDMKRYRGKVLKKGRFGPGCIREDLLALAYWVVEGDGKKDAVYPFSLPHLKFFQRCQAVVRRADIWVSAPRSQAERRALRDLEEIVLRLQKDKRFQDARGMPGKRLVRFYPGARYSAPDRCRVAKGGQASPAYRSSSSASATSRRDQKTSRTLSRRPAQVRRRRKPFQAVHFPARSFSNTLTNTWIAFSAIRSSRTRTARLSP